MIGKVIGSVIGLGFGPLGAICGFFIGSLFDRGRQRYRETPEQLQIIQQTFFKTTFTLIGYLAKADGRVSEQEIGQTQLLMDKMELTADRKRAAIASFKVGAEPGFDPDEVVREFKKTCGHRARLTQMLLIYLINTLLADGRLDDNAINALRRVAAGLNISNVAFEQLLRMIYAQESFFRAHYQQQTGMPPDSTEIANAYAALGVSESDSDADIKTAYRKLISEYHPDKLSGQGLPDNMIAMATQRSQEIHAAYNLIKKVRKGKE